MTIVRGRHGALRCHSRMTIACAQYLTGASACRPSRLPCAATNVGRFDELFARIGGTLRSVRPHITPAEYARAVDSIAVIMVA